MKLRILVEWIKQAIFIILIYSVVINAQNYKLNSNNEVFVDTSDFFPLQDGNYWEYFASTIYGPVPLNLKVIGDTLMPNGKIYKYFLETEDYTFLNEYYFRIDTNNIFQYYGDSVACPERDFKYLDFKIKDSSFWEICRDLGTCGNARGVANTYYDYTYYTYLNKPLETKHFQDVLLDATDTIWTPCEGREYWLSKAIGITRIFYFNVGDFWLTGAIVNGQQFGTLVSIDDQSDVLPDELELLQNYPNPFNPTTNIQYAIGMRQFMTLKVYDVLGKEIATLINEEKSAGNYEVSFNASNLASGIYYYQLRAGEFVETKKMILLK